MKWKRARRSTNVEDRRSIGGGTMKLGLGGLAVVVVLGLFMGKSPMEMLAMVSQIEGQRPGVGQPVERTAAEVEAADFIASILGETEDVWSEIFQRRGETYPTPRLVLFTGRVSSACGGASAVVGPFYCPGDRTINIVVPDSFTHGTSEQRVRWFRLGLDSGVSSACDSFAAERL